MHVRSRADEGNSERSFWLNCEIVEKEPEVKAMLIEPTTDRTGRLLKEYQIKNYTTHLSLGHLHGQGIKRALEIFLTRRNWRVYRFRELGTNHAGSVLCPK